MDVSCLLSYQSNEGENIKMIGCDNSYTVKALYRLGFAWPLTDITYIVRMIKGLAGLHYFN